MSLSKVAQKCQICGIGKGIYSCPRCSRKYCSSYCYKSREHESCSEEFFKGWVQETLKEQKCDQELMLKVLQNFEKESDEINETGESSFEERFKSLNFYDLDDESKIWDRFNDEEKAKFKSFIEVESNLESIIPVKMPWWTSTTLNLVSEIDTDSNNIHDDIADRPPFPLNAKPLSDLTTIKPSKFIPFNLVNIIYAYAFLYRFFNCELRDFLEEVVDLLFIISPVLLKGKVYTTLMESVQDSIRLINSRQLDVPMSFVKSIVNDVSNIMLGPHNARPSTFVLCALHDIKLLLSDLINANYLEKSDKQMRKKLLTTIKKVEYYMGWSSEYETLLSGISSELLLLMLPDLVPNNIVSHNETVKVDVGKPLIEELN